MFIKRKIEASVMHAQFSRTSRKSQPQSPRLRVFLPANYTKWKYATWRISANNLRKCNEYWLYRRKHRSLIISTSDANNVLSAFTFFPAPPSRNLNRQISGPTKQTDPGQV